MELKMTEGCVCWSYTVDGVEWNDLPIEKQRELCKLFIDKIEDTAILQDIFESFMREKADYEDGGICEECGDHIEHYELTI